MKVLVQRVKNASVRCLDVYEEIGEGLLLYVGFTDGDDINTLSKFTNKVLNLRIFNDENGVMNKSLMDIKGSILSISQFTLYGDAKKGNRPSYVKALNGTLAKPLYDEFNSKLRMSGLSVKEGVFGGDMKISSLNDGPVTIMLD